MVDRYLESHLANRVWKAFKGGAEKQAVKKRAPQNQFRIGDEVYLSTKFLQLGQHCKKWIVTVEWELSKPLRRIHLVFHCSLSLSVVHH